MMFRRGDFVALAETYQHGGLTWTNHRLGMVLDTSRDGGTIHTYSPFPIKNGARPMQPHRGYSATVISVYEHQARALWTKSNHFLDYDSKKSMLADIMGVRIPKPDRRQHPPAPEELS